MVVGRLLSYWEENFAGAKLNFGGVLLALWPKSCCCVWKCWPYSFRKRQRCHCKLDIHPSWDEQNFWVAKSVLRISFYCQGFCSCSIKKVLCRRLIHFSTVKVLSHHCCFLIPLQITTRKVVSSASTPNTWNVNCVGRDPNRRFQRVPSYHTSNSSVVDNRSQQMAYERPLLLNMAAFKALLSGG